MGIVLSSELKRNALINGLILGLILLAFNIISFYLITTIIKSPIGVIAVPYVFSIILPIPLAITFCYRLRIRMGISWDLRIATSGIFIMFLVAYACIFVGRDLLFAHIIEPKMNTKIENVLLAATPIALKQSGANEKQIAEKQKQIKDQFAVQDNVTIWQQIESQVISIILIFAIALIFGALFKRPAVVYATIVDNDPIA